MRSDGRRRTRAERDAAGIHKITGVATQELPAVCVGKGAGKGGRAALGLSHYSVLAGLLPVLVH